MKYNVPTQYFIHSMKKFFLIISSILFLVSCGGSSETEEPKVSVQCVTGNATDITHVTASVSGAVSVSGTTSGSIQAAFYYSTASSDAKTLAASGKKVPAGALATNEGTFSASFNDLEPSTTYFYVASSTRWSGGSSRGALACVLACVLACLLACVVLNILIIIQMIDLPSPISVRANCVLY